MIRKIKLTDKLLGMMNASIGINHEFIYTDWDMASKDWSGKLSKRECRLLNGRPRRDISFFKTPKGKKRSQLIVMKFDDDGFYEGIDTFSFKHFTTKELNEYEREAIYRLICSGIIQEVD